MPKSTKYIQIVDHWLDRVKEDIVDPDLPIIDSHFHLCSTELGGPVDYLRDDYLGDTSGGHNFIASVFMECGTSYLESGPQHLRPAGETAWINSIAEASEINLSRGGASKLQVAAAIIGYVDLTLGDKVEEVLEAHFAAAPTRLRGVRRSTSHSESNEVVGGRGNHPRHLLLDPKFQRGVARLARHGLTFDAWLYFFQIPELIALAQACPETPIVINHLGGLLGIGPFAGHREEVFSQWKTNMEELAKCNNVYVKLGGSGMKIWGLGWEQRQRPPTSDEFCAATQECYLSAIDCFSPARCMFESNFPVDKEHVSANVLWNGFKKISARYSPSERSDLFCNTAARFYRLNI